MSSHETRSKQSTGSRRHLSANNQGQNDLKKLKTKYASQLTFLKELFPDWSDDDLLFALQDAEGELEVAIDRISEGHAVQWGEVKSKKSKKETLYKAKPQHADTQTLTTSRQERSMPMRNHSDRGRDGKAFRGGAGGRGKAGSQHTRGRQPKTANGTESTVDNGGTWASVASKQQNSDSAWQDASGKDASNDATSWNKPTWETETTSQGAESNSTANPSAAELNPPAKTWASLLKSKPKPEPVPEPAQDAKPEPTNDSKENTATDGWDEPIAAENREITAQHDEWNAPVSNGTWDTTAPAITHSTLPSEELPADKPIDETPTPESEKAPTTTSNTTETTTAATSTASDKEPSPKPASKKPAFSRRLKQDVPVVLPNASTTLSAMDVKFGSLNLDDTTAEPEIDKRVTESLKRQEADGVNAPQEPQGQQPVSDRNPANTHASNGHAENANAFGSQATSYLKQDQAPATFPAQQPQQPQQQPQQQQQPQPQQQLPQFPQPQHYGADHLASAYGSYAPGQPASGYNMNPMGSMPDYTSMYSDAHRAAAMGYYDPNMFSNSPSVTAASVYQTLDKYNQDNTHPQTASAQAQNAHQQAQHMYPNMPYGYHQYYYMPNHFNAYQQSYGQPFVGKNMYPVYQNSGKPGATSASPYATGSPYTSQAQHLYNQSYAGYDEMSTLQHQFGGAGLQDYTKGSYNPQLQGYLGQLSGQQLPGATQNMAQGQQPSANVQSQVAQSHGKSDVNNAPYKPNQQTHHGNASLGAASQQSHAPPPQQQQQQQPQQQAAYLQQQGVPTPVNYFNQQPQMFYPQIQHFQQQLMHPQQQPQQPQQLQQLQQQQQQQQQQPPLAQQPSSVGRQQHYWSQ